MFSRFLYSLIITTEVLLLGRYNMVQNGLLPDDLLDPTCNCNVDFSYFKPHSGKLFGLTARRALVPIKTGTTLVFFSFIGDSITYTHIYSPPVMDFALCVLEIDTSETCQHTIKVQSE